MSLEKLVHDANTCEKIGRAYDILSDRIAAARERLVSAEEGYRKLLSTLRELQAKCTHPELPKKMTDMFGTTTCPHCGGRH